MKETNLLRKFNNLPPKTFKVLRDELENVLTGITDEDEKRRLTREIAKFDARIASE